MDGIVVEKLPSSDIKRVDLGFSARWKVDSDSIIKVCPHCCRGNIDQFKVIGATVAIVGWRHDQRTGSCRVGYKWSYV